MDREHIVRSYDEDLERLNNMVMEMGGMAQAQFHRAMEALLKRNEEVANAIVMEDERIDSLERELDLYTVELIARRQPMADDLRIVIAGLRVSANLERIGDYAKNIAKRTTVLSQGPNMASAMNTLRRMGSLVEAMLNNVLDAFSTHDLDKADQVRAQDTEVDMLHTSLFRELLTHMMEDPRTITTCAHLLFVAKNVERIGDHVTSIAEQIYFMVKGEVPDDVRPKVDESSFTFISGSKEKT